MQTSATFAWFPAQGKGLFLGLKEAILENPQDLLVPSSLRNHIPWHSSKHIPMVKLHGFTLFALQNDAIRVVLLQIVIVTSGKSSVCSIFQIPP